MSGHSPVDQPPGKDGYQGRNPRMPEPPVPEYEPYMNPPGTNPPRPSAKDPATTPIPGSIPGEGPPAPDAPPPDEPAHPAATNALPLEPAHPALRADAKHGSGHGTGPAREA